MPNTLQKSLGDIAGLELTVNFILARMLATPSCLETVQRTSLGFEISGSSVDARTLCILVVM